MASCSMLSSATAAPKLALRSGRATCIIARAEKINVKGIDADSAKVVTMLKAADGKGKDVMCRCWLSGTFPNCDGSHVKHNKATEDNVGPLIIQYDD